MSDINRWLKEGDPLTGEPELAAIDAQAAGDAADDRCRRWRANQRSSEVAAWAAGGGRGHGGLSDDRHRRRPALPTGAWQRGPGASGSPGDIEGTSTADAIRDVRRHARHLDVHRRFQTRPTEQHIPPYAAPNWRRSAGSS